MSFFFHYLCLFSLLNYVYRYYIVFRGIDGLMESYDEGTGPNDAKRVVCAPGVFFFKIFVFLSLLNYVFRYYKYFRATKCLPGGYDEGIDQWETTMRETGPNDAKRVGWAPGVFFINYSSLFRY